MNDHPAAIMLGCKGCATSQRINIRGMKPMTHRDSKYNKKSFCLCFCFTIAIMMARIKQQNIMGIAKETDHET
jgi:hypothetical protein